MEKDKKEEKDMKEEQQEDSAEEPVIEEKPEEAIVEKVPEKKPETEPKAEKKAAKKTKNIAEKHESPKKTTDHEAHEHHEHTKKEYIYNSDEDDAIDDNISGRFWKFIGVIIVLAIIGFAVKSYMAVDEGNTTLKDTAFLGDKAEVQFYVMSQCPYGTIVEDAIAPLLSTMGDAIDLKIDYIAREGADGTFTSLHGQPEVDENIRQLCAMKHNPDEYMDYIVCQNKDISNAEDNFEDCAEEAGLDIKAMKVCIESDEGNEILSKSIAKAEYAEATGSPTIYIDGELYMGGRDTTSFQAAICQVVEHESCGDIPACSTDAACPPKEGKIPKCINPGEKDAECTYEDPVEVYMFIVTDDDCATCDTTRIVDTTEMLFPGVSIETLDIDSEDGQAVIEAFDLVYMPAYIFSSDVKDTYSWNSNPNMRSAFIEIDGSYKLRDEATGSTTFIDEEKRDEQEELLNNYPEENLEVLDYDSGKPRLDYFVMAFCPYGNPADEAASQLYDLFGDKVEIVPHYIVSVSGNKIQSLHGEQEGNQGIRELCALEELGAEDFFAFTLKVNEMCSASDADRCWESAAEAAEVDADVIAACEDESALDIAAEQNSIIQNLKSMYRGTLQSPSASPTFLINGRTYEGGRDANALKSALCTIFDKAPAECGETIDASTTPVSGNC